MKNTIFANKSIRSFLDFFFKSSNLNDIYLSYTRENKWFWKNCWIYFFKRYSWSNCICSSSWRDNMPYSGFWIFYLWRKSKNRFSIFIAFSYNNNNNFSFIPFPSKSGVYESRIDRWVNYCCIKGTKIKILI